MKKLNILLLFLCGLIYTVYAQQEALIIGNGKKVLLWNDGSWVYADSLPLNKIKPQSIQKLELPAIKPKDEIVTHTGFTLMYSETHEQAAWVAYELTKEETNKRVSRTNKFKPDPYVKTRTATDKDYASSGFDRGHLAPAADMGWSETTMAESFYYSNMSPQVPGFNRGVWKKLEELVRNWAIENNSIYVITGPVLTPGLPAIGPNQVSVPNFYYKVILDYSEPGVKAIGFILPNQSSAEPLQKFAVSVDSVEALTGLDFFPLLPDDQEKLIEKMRCVSCWTWDHNGNKNINEKEKENATSTSVQCSGTTKAGSRCRNNTLNSNGYCHVHQQQVGGGGQTQTEQQSVKSTTSTQCMGTTKKGKRCSRMTRSSNGYCYQHGGN